MNATTDQTETLLQDLERRVGVPRECSAAVETQLKVMLVQLSRGAFPNAQVVRIARTLASCLIQRGDWAQAEQYAKMAANLERMHGGVRPPVAASPIPSKLSEPAADPVARREVRKGTGPAPDSVGPALGLPRTFASLWGAWTALSRRTEKRLGR